MPTNTKALQVAEPAGIVAGKNAVINGGFDIWQRGTSGFASGTNTLYCADRYFIHRGGSVTGATASRQATSDTTNLPFIQYCIRYQRDSGNTSTQDLLLIQQIETVNSIPLAGKTVTLSFYARAGANYSASSNALSVSLYTGTGTDQNIRNTGFTGQATTLSQTATLTTTWQRFTYTVTLPSTTTEIAMQWSYVPVGTAGANDYFEITGVQLELGSVATPFSRAGGTIQGELAACQRYFQSLNGSLSVYGASSDAIANYYRHQVQMRTAPTVTITTNPTYTNASALTNDENSVTGSRFYVTVTATGRAFATNFVYSASSEL